MGPAVCVPQDGLGLAQSLSPNLPGQIQSPPVPSGTSSIKALLQGNLDFQARWLLVLEFFKLLINLHS